MCVRKSFSARNAVKIVMNGVNAGIVDKAFFGQNVQRPQRRLGNRPTRRAISPHFDTGSVFNRLLCLSSVGAELIECEAVHGPMPIAMAGKLMSAGVDLTHQVRKMLGHPSHEE